MFRKKKINENLYRKSEQFKNLKAHIQERQAEIITLQKNLLSYFNAEILVAYMRYKIQRSS